MLQHASVTELIQWQQQTIREFLNYSTLLPGYPLFNELVWFFSPLVLLRFFMQYQALHSLLWSKNRACLPYQNTLPCQTKISSQFITIQLRLEGNKFSVHGCKYICTNIYIYQYIYLYIYNPSMILIWIHSSLINNSELFIFLKKS